MSKLSDRINAAAKIMFDAGLTETEDTIFVGNDEYKVTVKIQYMRTIPESPSEDINPYD